MTQPSLEPLFIAPNDMTLYLRYNNNDVLIDLFYYFSLHSESKTLPEFGITDTHFTYAAKSKNYITGEIGIHFIHKLYMVACLLGAAKAFEDLEDGRKTAVDQIATYLQEKNITIQEYLQGLPPKERTKFVDSMNNHFDKKINSDYFSEVPGLETLNVTGLDLVLKPTNPNNILFNKLIDASGDISYSPNTHLDHLNEIVVHDVHFVASDMKSSVDANAPLLMIYSFFGRM